MALFTKKLREEMHGICAALRDELDDHREAINEQGRDVLDVREALNELDEKIEKLASRIDEVYLLLGADAVLSSKEHELVSYLQTPRSLDEIAAFVQTSVPGAERSLRVLTLKGVAVVTASSGMVTTNGALKGAVSLNEYF